MTTARTAAAAAITAILLTSGCSNETSEQPPAPPTSTQGTATRTPRASPTPITPQVIPPGNPTGTPAGGLPRASQVNNADATSVAVAAVAVTYRHDTAIDNSPADAQRRARRWLSPALAAQLDGGQLAAPGAEWNTWVQHRAYTTSAAVNATEDGAPEDTPTRADRTIAVTVQAIGRDRWRGQPQQYALFITLNRASTKAPWQVSQLQVQE